MQISADFTSFIYFKSQLALKGKEGSERKAKNDSEKVKRVRRGRDKKIITRRSNEDIEEVRKEERYGERNEDSKEERERGRERARKYVATEREREREREKEKND